MQVRNWTRRNLILSDFLQLADLTVSKKSGTSYQIGIHLDVVHHLYLSFSFVKLVETLQLSLIKKIVSLPEIYKQSKLYFMRNLIIWIEKWIST